ncbi:SDR family oxidoreductase [Nonomuraea roseoviolacea subsp. roseoviolacea]|uniref:NAD(P)-dependent dehydrogenase (Short-subunit alcohol dehydrogenase family) n=1 Tax=Nonomuraea roseoviolacea subsp. carminata TaxID=160689 RepID=A0ABT1KGZ8_9ACTN|nr:SDR family NAD(P)-dependent oxidoreductase [Nonomuraea roseoviolacea]MCP2352867.1 NAD(P)-dependent dehydrogenase (short-subunit alcohol dehydrogenase family) [Nonomuraea roseoviolacea subsp. carminata]
MKTVLITGTSSGVGLATAVAAARAGFATVATMRDPDRAGELLEAAGEAGVEVDVRRLDVTEAGSPESCLRGVREDYGRLDALVNNAGVSNFDPTMEMSTMEALRANLEVNFFGVIAVSRVAMPLLRASGGRLVSVGSVHGVVGQPFNEAYAAAKFAVEGFMESLAPVAASQGVTVSVVVPGFVADTRFGIFPDINRKTIQAASGPYARTFADYIDWVRGAGWEGAGQSKREVAEVIVGALTAEDPPFRIATSAWVSGYLAAKLADADGSAVRALARTWIGAPE